MKHTMQMLESNTFQHDAALDRKRQQYADEYDVLMQQILDSVREAQNI